MDNNFKIDKETILKAKAFNDKAVKLRKKISRIIDNLDDNEKYILLMGMIREMELQKPVLKLATIMTDLTVAKLEHDKQKFEEQRRKDL